MLSLMTTLMTPIASAEPKMWRIIFNLTPDVFGFLQSIPKGDRSSFVNEEMRRSMRIHHRIRAVEEFDRSGKKMKIKRVPGGYDG